MPLSIQLNGQPRTLDLAAPATVEDLLHNLGLKPDRIALELNGEIAPRSTWPNLTIADGDRIEIVHFVGGGNSLLS